MNLTVVFGVLSFYYAKMRNYQKSRIYIELHSQKIAEQDSGAHPFPLMSCLFSLMAMYEIYNSAYFASGNALPGTTPINRSRGDAILQRIVTYLQTDSFKLVAHPLICLTDAMRSFIIPNNKKEGGIKLAHGYQEMRSSMDGIAFIKAYFLSQLGRHSTPELKHEYHMQAHNLFHSMALEPTVWLNDPIPNRRPLQAEECQSDTVSEHTPPSSFSSVRSVRGDDIEWEGSRNSIDSGDSRGRIAPLALPPLKIPVAGVATTQDEVIGLDMKLSSSAELDEGLFDTELAIASVPSAPIVHDMQEHPDQGEMAVQGAATPA
ncbi:hypothetical protein BGX26_010115 [Mortierella sp. AD094]|nr:hypothetical protein BGX26_010115 [Mortierella sp. AD094]